MKTKQTMGGSSWIKRELLAHQHQTVSEGGERSADTQGEQGLCAEVSPDQKQRGRHGQEA